MKALIGVLIFATIFGLILLVMICRFVYRIYVRLRNTKRAMEDALGVRREERGERREERGERREERGGRREERREERGERSEGYYEEPRRTRTESGEVIIDRRHEERKQKKIFSQDDGEYVDYVES